MAARSAAYPLMMEENPEALPAKQSASPASIYRPSKRVIALVVFMGILAVILVILLPSVIKRPSSETEETRSTRSPCTGDCTVTLVESIPENVKFPSGSIINPSIYNGWVNLLKIAEERIDIASFYWTLRGSDTNTSDPSTQQGDHVFEELEAVAGRGTAYKFS